MLIMSLYRDQAHHRVLAEISPLFSCFPCLTKRIDLTRANQCMHQRLVDGKNFHPIDLGTS